jgi:hypothetical protein
MSFVTDLRTKFLDNAIRGLSFDIVDNPFGNADIDDDGYTLRVLAGYRGAEPYVVSVTATSEPYGVRAVTSLPLYVSESDPPPVTVGPAALEAAFSGSKTAGTPSSPIMVASRRGDGDPLRIPLEPRVDAHGALSFQVLGVAPVYDSVYVDPSTQPAGGDLVIEGIDDLDVTYVVSMRAEDTFGQTTDLSVTVRNVAPPRPVARSTPHIFTMPLTAIGAPLLINGGLLGSFFMSSLGRVVAYSITSDPCDMPARAAYDAKTQTVIVSRAPVTIAVTAYDSLGQASTSPYTLTVV